MIKWKITALDAVTEGPYSGFVSQAHWKCWQGEGRDEVFIVGSEWFKEGDENFVPFKNLTEQQVLGWIWNVLNRAEIEAKVSVMAAEKANPSVIEPTLPWGN